MQKIQTQKILEKQSVIRCVMIDELREKIKVKNFRKLILYGDDNEIINGTSENQINKVIIQEKHVLKILEIAEDVFARRENITWKEACEETTKVLLSDISGETVERWFIIYKNNNYKFFLS